MCGLLFFLDFIGEQHVVNPLLQHFCVFAFCAPARKTVHLGLDLSRMRRQEQDAVAYLDGFGDRMRDENHREPRIVPELKQLVLHLAPRERVECRERLVHQQHVGLHGHPTRNRNPLLHAAGQRVRKAVDELDQVHLFDIFERLVLGRFPRQLAARGQREGDVFLHRLPWKKLIEFLEDHHPIGTRPADDLPF
jgi:hypothetical protein